MSTHCLLFLLCTYYSLIYSLKKILCIHVVYMCIYSYAQVCRWTAQGWTPSGFFYLSTFQFLIKSWWTWRLTNKMNPWDVPVSITRTKGTIGVSKVLHGYRDLKLCPSSPIASVRLTEPSTQPFNRDFRVSLMCYLLLERWAQREGD